MLGLSQILILVTAIFFPGIISLVKAKLSGRKGASILQPAYDIYRLLRKGSVYSPTTTLVFKLAPTFYLSAILVVVMLVPFRGQGGLISFEGDIVLFAYMLGLGRFMMILAALDTGSGFEGMGANREALYGMLVEPAMFLILGSLCLFTSNTSFVGLFVQISPGDPTSYLVIFIAIFLLVQIAMIENSRLPVDDPKTHLELTMVHEVMVLDHSGFDLGIIHLGTAVKFAIFGGLIFNFLIPQSLPIWVAIPSFLGIQAFFAITIAWLESFRARHKMAANPRYILTLSAIAFLMFFTVLIMTHKFIIN